ncbi:hypothetical protein RND81_08G116200 [Saponaria officinalis]|uniref:Uncharacterized protein n=1 Tax=Saponaria officinalis TaxID=3572 RepID=A0AAW1J7P3_SAPOF
MNNMSNNNGTTTTPLHMAMYPWFAMGHITSFLRLSNKLAQKGHKISFFLPTKTIAKFASQNHHPKLITLIPINVPHINGLPNGAETARDVPTNPGLLMSAMDLTRDTVDDHLADLRPNLIFFDFAHWIPEIAQKYGIKSICYYSGLLVRYAYILPLALTRPEHRPANLNVHLLNPPPYFPSPSMRLQTHETRAMTGALTSEFGLGLMFIDRIGLSIDYCDAIGVKSCREMEGGYCDYVEKKLGKPVLTAGPVLPDPHKVGLDHKLDDWLMGFGCESVVYCAFGSECQLDLAQFQELLLGFELTGFAKSKRVKVWMDGGGGEVTRQGGGRVGKSGGRRPGESEVGEGRGR